MSCAASCAAPSGTVATSGFKEPFFYKLVDVVAANFGDVFPELRRNKAKIQSNLKAEEESFNRTLDRGLEKFEFMVHLIDELKEPRLGREFPADTAFELYDTYGFPFDLTELMARERGLTVDEDMPEYCIIGGIVFAFCAYLLWRLRSNLMKDEEESIPNGEAVAGHTGDISGTAWV